MSGLVKARWRGLEPALVWSCLDGVCGLVPGVFGACLSPPLIFAHVPSQSYCKQELSRSERPFLRGVGVCVGVCAFVSPLIG